MGESQIAIGEMLGRSRFADRVSLICVSLICVSLIAFRQCVVCE